MIDHRNYIIIGAGIVGLSVAREIRFREPEASILVLEKENKLGMHGSGRNSGVIHSGIYYKKGTLKAKVCADGAKAILAYCSEKNLPINRIGKVIVPTNEEEDVQLKLLEKRASVNNAYVEIINESQLREIEPAVYSATGNALYSPNTSVIDPVSVMLQLYKDLTQQNIKILLSSRVSNADPCKSMLHVGGKTYKYDFLVNAAGQHSDRVAKMYDVGMSYALIPFRGSYYKLRHDSRININHLIYPVPDLDIPFLGIHSVTAINGDIYFGPSAIPALGREHYSGVKGLEFSQAFNTMYYLFGEYIRNSQGFRRYTHEELSRIYKKKFTVACQKLIPSLTNRDLIKSEKVGIRAQLYDISKRKLEMDFVIRRKDNTVHVLNGVSPAFTSSFSMAKIILDS